MEAFSTSRGSFRKINSLLSSQRQSFHSPGEMFKPNDFDQAAPFLSMLISSVMVVVAFWVLRLTYLPFARLRATNGRARLVNRAKIWSRHEMKLVTL